MANLCVESTSLQTNAGKIIKLRQTVWAASIISSKE